MGIFQWNFSRLSLIIFYITLFNSLSLSLSAFFPCYLSTRLALSLVASYLKSHYLFVTTNFICNVHTLNSANNFIFAKDSNEMWKEENAYTYIYYYWNDLEYLLLLRVHDFQLNVVYLVVFISIRNAFHSHIVHLRILFVVWFQLMKFSNFGKYWMQSLSPTIWTFRMELFVFQWAISFFSILWIWIMRRCPLVRNVDLCLSGSVEKMRYSLVVAVSSKQWPWWRRLLKLINSTSARYAIMNHLVGCFCVFHWWILGAFIT